MKILDNIKKVIFHNYWSDGVISIHSLLSTIILGAAVIAATICISSEWLPITLSAATINICNQWFPITLSIAIIKSLSSLTPPIISNAVRNLATRSFHAGIYILKSITPPIIAKPSEWLITNMYALIVYTPDALTNLTKSLFDATINILAIISPPIIYDLTKWLITNIYTLIVYTPDALTNFARSTMHKFNNTLFGFIRRFGHQDHSVPRRKPIKSGYVKREGASPSTGKYRTPTSEEIFNHVMSVIKTTEDRIVPSQEDVSSNLKDRIKDDLEQEDTGRIFASALEVFNQNKKLLNNRNAMRILFPESSITTDIPLIKVVRAKGGDQGKKDIYIKALRTHRIRMFAFMVHHSPKTDLHIKSLWNNYRFMWDITYPYYGGVLVRRMYTNLDDEQHPYDETDNAFVHLDHQLLLTNEMEYVIDALGVLKQQQKASDRHSHDALDVLQNGIHTLRNLKSEKQKLKKTEEPELKEITQGILSKYQSRIENALSCSSSQDRNKDLALIMQEIITGQENPDQKELTLEDNSQMNATMRAVRVNIFRSNPETWTKKMANEGTKKMANEGTKKMANEGTGEGTGNRAKKCRNNFKATMLYRWIHVLIQTCYLENHDQNAAANELRIIASKDHDNDMAVLEDILELKATITGYEDGNIRPLPMIL